MQPATAPTAEVIDLADVLRAIRNRWIVVASVTAVSVLAAIGVILFFPPSFSGSASLLVKTGGNNTGGSLASAIAAMSDIGGGGGGGAFPAMQPGVETEVEILQSRVLASQVVDSLRLQAQVAKPRSVAPNRAFAAVSLPGSFRRVVYKFTPVSPATNPVSFRFKAENDSGVAVAGQAATLKIGSITVAPTAPTAGFEVAFRDHDDAITMMLERLKFTKPKTDVAHFTYAAGDSVSSAEVPNLLVDLYLERRRGIDRGTNQRRAEFLAAKVDSVGRALSAAEDQLRAQREASGLIDPMAAGRTQLENENRLRQQLTDIQVQEGALQQLVAQINDGVASPRQLSSYPQYLGSGPINNIVANLIGVETERQALLGTVTEEDERVKALAVRAKRLEGELMPLAQATLTALASQRTSITQRLRTVEQSLVGVPQAAETYGRLERDIIDRGRIYAGLQTQLVDARLAAISEGGDVKPLDRASPPKKPSFPKKTVTLAAGLGGGLFIGLLCAALLGIVGERMHDAQDVERRTGLPAVRLEPSSPLLVGGRYSRTIVVAPINSRAVAKPVAERLVETALARSLTATLLDLSSAPLRDTPLQSADARLIAPKSLAPLGFDAAAAVRKLEETHDLVVVQLPALSSHEAAAVLDDTKPVLLVAPERRIERSSIQSAVDLLRRVGAPCAGVVLNGDDRKKLRA